MNPLVFFGVEPCATPLAAEMARERDVRWVTISVPQRQSRPNRIGALRCESWTYPPGFNGVFRFIFAVPIRHRVRRLSAEMRAAYNLDPIFVISYPKFAPYLSDVPASDIIYYNVDDNDERIGGLARQQPDETVLLHRSRLVVCTSVHQTRRFEQQCGAQRVVHLPHGIQSVYINADVQKKSPDPVVSIAGGIGRRYDWRAIRAVVYALPQIQFHFIGRVHLEEKDGEDDWFAEWNAVTAAANVRHTLPNSDDEITKAVWNSHLTWIPYDPSLPFNLASCPLKLFTGLGSGRPIVSARIPESELHADWVSVYDSPEGAVSAIQEGLAADSAHRATRQLEYARSHEWRHRATVFRDLLRAPARPS